MQNFAVSSREIAYHSSEEGNSHLVGLPTCVNCTMAFSSARDRWHRTEDRLDYAGNPNPMKKMCDYLLNDTNYAYWANNVKWTVIDAACRAHLCSVHSWAGLDLFFAFFFLDLVFWTSFLVWILGLG